MSGNSFTVYKHETPNGKVYIGITSINPVKRWKNGTNYKTSPLFYNAILKYGWDNIKHEILYSNLTKEEAERKEIELIALYKSNLRECGYNLDSGGHLGSHRGKDTLEKMSAAAKKMWQTEGFREKWISQRIGKKHTKTTKEKQRAAALQRIDNKKPVVQLDLNGNYINTYRSMNGAEQVVGISRSMISKCCKGEYKQAGGYIWRLADGSK